MENPAYLFNPMRLRNRLIKLHEKRKASKQPAKRTKRLTKSERAEILSKTDGKCHICGQKLSVDKFQADHVVSHVRGGQHHVDNYLPACFVCNNYRWHYLPEELQLILKIGVWARTEMEKGTGLGDLMAAKFVAKESRRKNTMPRRK